LRIPVAEGDVDASRLQDCVPEEERIGLDKLMRSKMTSVRLAQRARIILPSADRMRNCGIATMVWVGRIQVARWRGYQWGFHLKHTSRVIVASTVKRARLRQITHPGRNSIATGERVRLKRSVLFEFRISRQSRERVAKRISNRELSTQSNGHLAPTKNDSNLSPLQAATGIAIIPFGTIVFQVS